MNLIGGYEGVNMTKNRQKQHFRWWHQKVMD